jgi:apolipoprotein D and lipocalin family protein
MVSTAPGSTSRKAGLLALLSISTLLTGCLGMPPGVKPVDGFEIERYLGTWHEIARLDHSFERGLERVTAEYSLRADGGVRVVNRGFDTGKDAWSEAEGKAFFVEDEHTGYLKVSFFGPFYGSYVIFELEQDNYQYAFVSGPDTSYLWLLARKPAVNPQVMDLFRARAAALGFELDELILVRHEEG